MTLSEKTDTQPYRIKLGSFMTIGSPIITELAALSGFDWLLLDLEHGLGTESDLLNQLMALSNKKTFGIVRVSTPHEDQILRILDRGAQGIMLSHVESAEAAVNCIKSMRYKPHGNRGYSRTIRANGYGLGPLSDFTPLFLAQIESVEGVLYSDEIAAVDGVDVLFVGPADLTYDLLHGCCEKPIEYDVCLDKVIEAASNHGKESGILVRNVEDYHAMAAKGFTYIAIDSDIGILRNQFSAYIKQIKS